MKIADITPGIYVEQGYGPSRHYLVLDGGRLYAKPSTPDGVVTVAPTKRYAYDGSSGVLAVAAPQAWRRDELDLSDSIHLSELIEATDELFRLATTVSVEAASAKVSKIAGLPLVVRTDINPAMISRDDDILENTVLREATALAASLRERGLLTEILYPASTTPGVRLNLTAEQARTVLDALNNADERSPDAADAVR